MNKAIVMTLSAILVAGAAGTVMAEGKHCEGHGSKGYKGDHQEMSEHRIDRLAEHLALSDEQKASMKSIFEERHAKREGKKEVRDSFRAKMDSLDPESANYVAEVEKIAQEQSKEMVKNKVERAEMKAKIYAVLTDEQEEKFEKLKDHRKKKWGFGDKKHDGDRDH